MQDKIDGVVFSTEEEHMDVESGDGLITPQLYPVSANSSGEGLPYAPENWPISGDNWRWKVGKRVTNSGYFMDRCLYLPSRLSEDSSAKKFFQSKSSLEEYLRSEFPEESIEDFFSSFSWKVPSNEFTREFTPPISIGQTRSHLKTVKCKAGNRNCISLVQGSNNTTTTPLECNICCSERNFCVYCCCILCAKPTNSDYSGYGYIICEAKVSEEGPACGHIAHLECGLRAYMAGTVGGFIGLDAEYYCRRCDTRTDLVPHVTKLIQASQTIEDNVQIEKILSLGVCLLRGSQKPNALHLLNHLALAIAKLRKATESEDVWRKENTSHITSGENPVGNRNGSERQVEAIKLEDEINEILRKLKLSQEHEYKVAEEMLLVQKKDLQNLYLQLNKERYDLARHESLSHAEASLGAILERVEQIKRVIIKLKEMKQVENGFARTSKSVIKEHFGFQIDN